MVESESFLDSTRRMVVIGSRLARGCVAVGCVRVERVDRVESVALLDAKQP